MAEHRLYRVEGIVIKRIDVGEADRILTIYTPELGKIRAVAKGIRRVTSRLAGHVELFTHAHMQLARGRNLDVLTQSVPLHAYRALREDLWRTTYACAAGELIDRLAAENIVNRPLFDLFELTLQRLDANRDPEVSSRAFEVGALGHLGYRPELHRCVVCGDDLGPVGNFISPVAGGVLCFSCGRADVTARALTTNAFKVLRLLQSGDYETLSRVRLAEQLRRELEAVTRGYTAYILERDLKSASVITHLRSLVPEEGPVVVAGNTM